MSLLISKHIYEKLSGSSALSELVGDKIFPISTKTATTFPFVVYKRSSLTPNYTKDRYSAGDNTTVEVIVASNDYLNSVTIAEEIRNTLENKRGKYENFNVAGAKLVSADEDYIEDTYIQRLIFSIETE